MVRSYTSKGVAVPFEFELDGVAFTCTGGVQFLEFSELARRADLDPDSPAGGAALAEAFRSAFGENYEAFRLHCREHDTDSGTLLDILRDMMEHYANVPSQPLRSSSPGRLTTSGTSKVDLPQQPLTDEEIARWRAAVEEEAARSTRSLG